LVPASGFYEWRPIEGQREKQPHNIRLRDGRVFAFAGLWERWRRGDRVIESFAIITTRSNELVMPIHDRMPVILEPESYDLWLDPETELAVLEQLMVPLRANKMSQRPVSTFVNSPDNEGIECIEVVDEIHPKQGTLPF
jgi:putative SOS response-associated peptidase YedK